jgi:hypothetical protein
MLKRRDALAISAVKCLPCLSSLQPDLIVAVQQQDHQFGRGIPAVQLASTDAERVAGTARLLHYWHPRWLSAIWQRRPSW